MIKSGQILFCDELDRIKQTHARLTLQFSGPQSRPPALAGALTWDGSGCEWTAVFAGNSAQVQSAAAAVGARVVEQCPLSLDEIFLARSGAQSVVSGEEN
jgi:hypothetical protein